MAPQPKKHAGHDGVHWPAPYEFEYYPEIDDAVLARVREAAKAPEKDDPDWKVVDGPAW